MRKGSGESFNFKKKKEKKRKKTILLKYTIAWLRMASSSILNHLYFHLS